MGFVRQFVYSRQAIPVVVGLILVLNTIGLVIALVGEMPKEFGGAGDPSNVLGEAPLQGTLLSAPLAPILVLIGMAWLSYRSNWLGVIGLLGMIVVCVLFTVGYLGEPLHPKASDPPVAFIVAWKLIGIPIVLTLIAVCGLRLVEKVRSSGVAEP